MISLPWEYGSQCQGYCYPLPGLTLLFSWYTHSTIQSWGSFWLVGVFFLKREKGDNSLSIQLWGWMLPAQGLVLQNSWAPWTPRATHSFWKSNLTSSLVWHCKTKCPNQRVLFYFSDFLSAWKQVWNKRCYYPHLQTTGEREDLNIKHGCFSTLYKIHTSYRYLF